MIIKIASVLLSSAPLVLLFGSAYFATGGSSSWRESLLKIFAVLNRMPGTNMVRLHRRLHADV